MRSNFLLTAACALAGLVLCAGPTASAQSFEAAVTGGVTQIGGGNITDSYSGVPGAGDYVKLDNGWNLGFRMTVNPYDHFGFEVGYIYNRTNLNIGGQDQGGMAVHQGYGNALAYLTKSEARIRPFGTAGLNYSNFVPPGQSAQYGGGQNKFGFNYGGGIKVKLTGMWQARFDIRQFNTGKPGFGVLTGLSGRLLMTEYSAGIGVGF